MMSKIDSLGPGLIPALQVMLYLWCINVLMRTESYRDRQSYGPT